VEERSDEVRILCWIKNPGDKGQNGEALLEVATDKANVEIEGPADGELLDVSAKEADCIKFGAVLAVINKIS
jgi:pyruvate/2-oxoglutarate dehydrogenase complex dihydrolipoamide acyltransferase (E2) component